MWLLLRLEGSWAGWQGLGAVLVLEAVLPLVLLIASSGIEAEVAPLAGGTFLGARGSYPVAHYDVEDRRLSGIA